MADMIFEEARAERERQLADEGWSLEHDDEHVKAELALTAACYASPHNPYAVVSSTGTPSIGVPAIVTWQKLWPWEPQWDKRHEHNYRRRLIIAMALLAAEIERIDRAGLGNEPPEWLPDTGLRFPAF